MSDLVHVLEHHAKDKGDLAREISLAFTTLLRPAGWDILHLSSGPESYMICIPGTVRQWHFRNGGKGIITARNHWFHSRTTKRIQFKTRMDVWRWARNEVK